MLPAHYAQRKSSLDPTIIASATSEIPSNMRRTKKLNRPAFAIFTPTVNGTIMLTPRDGQDRPAMHETEREAQVEIAQIVIERLQQFLAGEREFADAITCHDFVLPVTVRPDATIQIQNGRLFSTQD